MSLHASAGPSSRRWTKRPCIPKSIFLIIAITRLSSSSFLASAQYTRSTTHPIDINHRRDQSSSSRDISISSFDDFCLFGPPDPFNYVWSSGLNVVSWCSKDGHGTRLIPDGTLHGVTYVKTKDYVQISGTGDLTKINWAPGDVGGQFDSSRNTPEGAAVKINGQNSNNWVTVISSNTFCFRACTGDAKFCPAQYDQLGCWFLTGNAVGPEGTWQNCASDSGDPPGVSDGETFDQNDRDIPNPTAPELRACQPGPSVKNGQPAPPLFPWNGQGGGQGGEQGGGQGSGSTGGSDGSSEKSNNNSDNHNNGQTGSTTWLPVETCQPCAQDPVNAPEPSPTGAATTTGGGLTQQVGITQVKSNNVANAVATTSPHSRPSAPPVNDDLDRRGEEGETITKNGQCCFTTYTPSIVAGGASQTSGKPNPTVPSQKGIPSGSHVSPGGVTGTFGGTVPSGQTTLRPSGSGGLVTGENTNGTGVNGTGTGNGTGAAVKRIIYPLGSLWGLIGSTTVIMAVVGVGMDIVV